MSVTPTPVNLQGKQDFFSLFLFLGGGVNFSNFLFCFLSIFYRGDGGSEAGRGRREANMLNVYDKCPTLKHLSQIFCCFFFWRGGGGGGGGGRGRRETNT